jgi:hypothetical protein
MSILHRLPGASIIEYPSVPDAEDAAKRLEGLQIRCVSGVAQTPSLGCLLILMPLALSVAPPLLSSSTRPAAVATAEEEAVATRRPRATPTPTAGAMTAATTAATTTAATTGACFHLLFPCASLYVSLRLRCL